MTRRVEAGFTLVELLIVVVILGVLGAVVVFAVGGLTDHAESSGCLAEANSFADAVLGHRAMHSNALPDGDTSTVGVVDGTPDQVAAVLYADDLVSHDETVFGGEVPGWSYDPATGTVDPSGCPT